MKRLPLRLTKKMVRVPFLIVSAGLFAVISPSITFAASVTVTDPVTVVLPSDGSTYTLSAPIGSPTGTFDQLTVSGGTMTFTMSSGESVLMTAAGNAALGNDAGLSYACGSQSTLIITAASTTVNVTPSGTCSFGAGAGGSGGSSSSVSTVTTASSTQATTTPSSAPNLKTATTSVATSTGSALSQTQIQAILSLLSSFNADPSVIENVKTALNGTGKRITLSAEPSFTRNLTVGMHGTDVIALQHYLNTHGFPVAMRGVGSLAKETSFFGKLTKAALGKFQRAAGIVPANGYFGAKTRAFILQETH